MATQLSITPHACNEYLETLVKVFCDPESADYKKKRRYTRRSNYDEVGIKNLSYDTFSRIKQLTEPGRLEVLLNQQLPPEEKAKQLGLSEVTVNELIQYARFLEIRVPTDANLEVLSDKASRGIIRKDLYRNLLRQTILEVGKNRNIPLDEKHFPNGIKGLDNLLYAVQNYEVIATESSGDCAEILGITRSKAQILRATLKKAGIYIMPLQERITGQLAQKYGLSKPQAHWLAYALKRETLFTSALSDKQISEQQGISQSTVYQARQKLTRFYRVQAIRILEDLITYVNKKISSRTISDIIR